MIYTCQSRKTLQHVLYKPEMESFDHPVFCTYSWDHISASKLPQNLLGMDRKHARNSPSPTNINKLNGIMGFPKLPDKPSNTSPAPGAGAGFKKSGFVVVHGFLDFRPYLVPANSCKNRKWSRKWWPQERLVSRLIRTTICGHKMSGCNSKHRDTETPSEQLALAHTAAPLRPQ